MTQHDGKVFGIGFYKTGTTTLYDALRTLGYHTVNGDTPGSYPGADDGATLIRQIDAGDFRLPTFEMFDAFTDNPYFRIWREIHALYPDARYILTVRDEDAWIASCVKFFRHRRIRPMRVWMFGPHANPGRDAGRAARPGSTPIARTTPRCARTSPGGRQQFLEIDPTRETRLGPAMRVSRRAHAGSALATREPQARRGRGVRSGAACAGDSVSRCACRPRDRTTRGVRGDEAVLT